VVGTLKFGRLIGAQRLCLIPALRAKQSYNVSDSPVNSDVLCMFDPGVKLLGLTQSKEPFVRLRMSYTSRTYWDSLYRKGEV